MPKQTRQTRSVAQPEANKIYLGDALTLLRSWPDNFIDCCVSSPPYYGARRYDTPPQIWDGDPNCKHKWGNKIPHPKADKRTPEEKASQGSTVGSDTSSAHHSPATCGQFCQKCPGWLGELGAEPHFLDYIRHMTQIYTEVYRCLKPTGTCWVNLGDGYNTAKIGNTDIHKNPKMAAAQKGLQKGLQAKSLMNIPHRFAIAMTDDVGFIQRNSINWHKPACRPDPAKDRFTVDFESIFFFTKSQKYYFDQQFESLSDATKRDYRFRNHNAVNKRPDSYDPGASQDRSGLLVGSQDMRNMRTTWTVAYEPSKIEHYASYPRKLIDIPIKAGCPLGGIVLDPFFGTGTTGIAALYLDRQFVGIELQPKYYEMSIKRLAKEAANHGKALTEVIARPELDPYIPQNILFNEVE